MGTELVRKPASASNGGELDSSTTQVIPGAKTFTSPLTGFVSGNDYRNLIINGNFDFWQRGTSFAKNLYTADRFFTSVQAAYTTTITRSTDVPTVAQSKFNSQYSWLITNGTSPGAQGASGYVQIGYKLEGYDYQALHGNTGRLQFWCKSSVAGTYSICLINSATSRSYVSTFTIGAANTWEKKTIDITFDNTGTWVFDNGIGLYIYINLCAGTSLQTSTLNTWVNGAAGQAVNTQTDWGATTGATFQLAQVALIPGNFNSAIDISHARAGRTIGDELRMCQRYYNKMLGADGNGNFASYVSAITASTSTFTIWINFPTPMRAIAPTPTFSGTNRFMYGNTSVALTGITASNQQFGIHGGYGVYNTSATLPAAGTAGAVGASADVSAYLAFDAEL
jgi:hypothetical protein